MSEPITLVLATAAGVLLGAMFFGGLWWTVRHALSQSRPAPWFLASMVLRTGAAAWGFYVVGNGHWERMTVCLLGFLAARLAVQRLTRAPASPGRQMGANHAP